MQVLPQVRVRTAAQPARLGLGHPRELARREGGSAATSGCEHRLTSEVAVLSVLLLPTYFYRWNPQKLQKLYLILLTKTEED